MQTKSATSNRLKAASDPKTRSHDEVSLLLTPRTITVFLLVITFILVIAHVIAVSLEINLPEESKIRRVIVQYFYFGSEANFPTYFSALLLLVSSILSFYIYKIDSLRNDIKNLKYWRSISLILLFLSMDEAVQIHEQMMSVMHYLIPNLPDILASAWVIPYALIFLFIAFFFSKFILSLPYKTRNLIILAGLTFVTGAIALEVFESYLYNEYGAKHFTFLIAVTLEELLEMAGIVLFIYALLDYILLRFTRLRVTIK